MSIKKFGQASSEKQCEYCCKTIKKGKDLYTNGGLLTIWPKWFCSTKCGRSFEK